MSSTVFKRVTNSGSLSIPVAIRRQQGIQPGDGVEITLTDDNKLVIAPYQLRCSFCETTEDVQDFHGKGICKDCIRKIISSQEG